MQSLMAIQIPCKKRNSLKLVFEKINDRWQHCWTLGNGTDGKVILASLEGTSNQAWPPSPPLQDIDRHVLDTGAAILGVGMAGKSHWSASFSIHPVTARETGSGESQPTNCPESTSQSTTDPLIIRSDLACLQKSENFDGRLGSEYRIDTSCQIQSVTDTRVELLTSGVTVCLNAFSANACGTRFQLNDRLLVIQPVNVSRNRSIATRWGFDVGMLG